MDRLRKIIEAAKGPQIEVLLQHQFRFYRKVLEGVRAEEPESFLVALEQSGLFSVAEQGFHFQLFLRTEQPEWTLIDTPFWKLLPIGLDAEHRWVAVS
jgi:hypothetical protein